MATMHLRVASPTRTRCGLPISNPRIRWTGGYNEAGRKVKVTCKSCLKKDGKS